MFKPLRTRKSRPRKQGLPLKTQTRSRHAILPIFDGPRTRGPRGWTTADELHFLGTLGSHSQWKTPRRTLLERYLASMSRRADWGAIDSFIVRQAVQNMLDHKASHPEDGPYA